MRCDICQNETRIIKKEKYQYTHSGLNNLFLKNIKVERCDNCNLEVPFIPKIVRLHETIARAIILKKAILNGEEVRFLRKSLLIKAQNWARYLRKDVSYISRVENGKEELSKDLDVVCRLMYVRLWEEKNEHFFGEKFVESISQLEKREIEILIDVENIESFSYNEKHQTWDDEIISSKFDSANELSVIANFGGESISFDTSSPFSLREFYAKNSELALAG